MKREWEMKPMTNQQLEQLSLRTCEWCHAVIVQGKRFLDVFENNNGAMPWDEHTHGNSLCAERLFLITALNHAIVCLERFNWELEQKDDITFSPVLDAISCLDERDKIRKLRNMNEHDIEYLTGGGNAQKSFISTVEKNHYCIQTNAFWTVLHGNAKLFLIGNVEIDQLLLRFKENFPAVKRKTEEVFMSSIMSS